MKYLKLTVAFALFAGFSSAYALPLVIDSSDDQGISGDYEVRGNTDQSAPGQVQEVLGGPTGDLPPGGPPVAIESEERTSTMGSLWRTLDDGGLTEATRLGFGFGLNEDGKTGTNFVTILDLTMTFERSGNPDAVFTLGDDDVEVWNYVQGAETFEAIFFVDLGFDFMSEYDQFSELGFTISANITDHDDGFEIFALSSGFSGGGQTTGVPEPGTLALLGLGLLGLGFSRRRRI